MLPSESPFPCQWWSPSPEAIGAHEGEALSDGLPPLPFEIRGDFEWLERTETHELNIGNEREEENEDALSALREAAERLGVRLPETFLRFMEDRSLARHLRSMTDCFLDLAEAPTASPVDDGHLVRFLADSQGCLFWYLYLPPEGDDHAVVSSTDFYDPDPSGDEDEAATDPAGIVFCGESFEAFLCRFWLENEIGFADSEQSPLPDVRPDLIEIYRSAGF